MSSSDKCTGSQVVAARWAQGRGSITPACVLFRTAQMHSYLLVCRRILIRAAPAQPQTIVPIIHARRCPPKVHYARLPRPRKVHFSHFSPPSASALFESRKKCTFSTEKIRSRLEKCTLPAVETGRAKERESALFGFGVFFGGGKKCTSRINTEFCGA